MTDSESAAKMTDKEVQRRRVPDWVVNHMERLHSGANLETICGSPPEAGGFDLPHRASRPPAAKLLPVVSVLRSESAPTTPQGSPSLVRRVTDLRADANRLKKNRYAVSNFDINAVSPTSW
ncbi:uncharacterized protein LOC135396521 [Ornithodoros turicata]|uniref:uncharacterized protein LOC135396521 n=1 Tax=Ornithodoros turicata TaxID=34597 RepID=UPI0031396CCF